MPLPSFVTKEFFNLNDFSVQNAQYSHQRGHSTPGRSLSNNSMPQFSSSAPLKGCVSITAHLKTIPQKRITGLSLSYDLRSPAGMQLAGNPWILGQISDTVVSSTFFLDANAGEEFKSAKIYYKSHLLHDSVIHPRGANLVAGVIFNTTRGRSAKFGVSAIEEDEDGHENQFEEELHFENKVRNLFIGLLFLSLVF